jgi:hypothetical protein
VNSQHGASGVGRSAALSQLGVRVRGVSRASTASRSKDPEALAALYGHVLAAFPDAYLEDPHDLPEIELRLGDHLERVSYDPPIRDAEDIGATPLAARIVNVKPSRIGSLRRLFDVYARSARERRPMYGGGMGSSA